MSQCPGGILECPYFRFDPQALVNTREAERSSETLADSISRKASNRRAYEFRQCWIGGRFIGSCEHYCSNSTCLRFYVARVAELVARVAELELPGNEEQEKIFAMLWTDYGGANPKKLTKRAQELRERLRAIVGMPELEEALRKKCPTFQGTLKERTEQEIAWRRQHDIEYVREEYRLAQEEIKRLEGALRLAIEALEAVLPFRTYGSYVRGQMEIALAALRGEPQEAEQGEGEEAEA